jgi:hypothetical protein
VEIDDLRELETCRVQKSCAETNHHGAEMNGFHRISIRCSVDVFEKSRNLAKKEKHLGGLLNPGRVNGSLRDSKIDIK